MSWFINYKSYVAKTCLLICLLEATAAIACPSEKVAPYEYLQIAQKMAQENNFDDSLNCINIGIRHYPKNRDLAFYKIRIYGWKGEITKAFSLLNKWKSNQDSEFYELAGDLFWYKETPKKASHFYRKAYLKSASNLPPVFWQKYIKSLHYSNQKSKAKTQWRKAIKKYPEDENLLSMYSLLFKKKSVEEYSNNDIRGGVVHFWRNQSQDQSTKEYYLDLSLRVKERFRVGLSSHIESRKYPDVKLEDRIFYLFLNYKWHKKSSITITHGYSNSPNFLPKTRSRLDIHLDLKTLGYLELGLQRSKYEDTISNLISLGYGILLKSVETNIKLYTSSHKDDGEAVMLKIKYYLDQFIFEIFGVSGRDDSSRSYLTNRDKVEFDKYGITFYHTPDYLPFRWFISHEVRKEPSFREEAYGVGLSWTLK